MNVNDIKKQLQNLGISTSTPGLQGDDRFEELSYRLEASKKKVEQTNQTIPSLSQPDEFVVPSLSQLSIGEIRSRLSALGESTNTPGITGEDRRNALMRRLINAVCMDENNINEITTKNKEGNSVPEVNVIFNVIRMAPISDTGQFIQVKPPSPIPPPLSPEATIPPPIEPTAPVIQEVEVDTTVTSTTISVLKKELKRLSNQRALYVASHLSGSTQDEALKTEEARLSRIEAEMSKFRALLQKGETKLPIAAIQSEFLVLNPAAQGFAIEALVSRLEGYRASSKDKIRNHRLRIREEGDEHPQYGVAVEEKLKALLSEANLASASNVTNTKVSRTRQKFADLREMESSLEQQGKVLPAVDSAGSLQERIEAAKANVGRNSPPQQASAGGSMPHPGQGKSSLSSKLDSSKIALHDSTSPSRVDKWSTEIAPGLAPSSRINLNSAEPPKPTPTPVQAGPGPPTSLNSTPNLTSAFLGKAIDLDRSPKASAKVPQNRVPPLDEVPNINSNRSPAANIALKKAGIPVVVSDQVVDRSNDTAKINTPTHINKNTSSVPKQDDVEVVRGRRPPPPPLNPPERDGRAGAPVPVSASVSGKSFPRSGTPAAPPLVHVTAENDDDDADEIDETDNNMNYGSNRNNDYSNVNNEKYGGKAQKSEQSNTLGCYSEGDETYFQEANDVVFANSSKFHPLRNVPLPATGETDHVNQQQKHMEHSNDEIASERSRSLAEAKRPIPLGTFGLSRPATANEEDEEVVTPFDIDEYGNPHYYNAGESNDYDEVYGTKRRVNTAEDDDDLEELSQSQSARSPTRAGTASTAGGWDSSRINSEEASQASQSRGGSAQASRAPSSCTSPLPPHVENIMHMPSIDENEQSEKKEKRTHSASAASADFDQEQQQQQHMDESVNVHLNLSKQEDIKQEQVQQREQIHEHSEVRVERKLDYVTVDSARNSINDEGEDQNGDADDNDNNDDNDDNDGDAQQGLEGDEADEMLEKDADEKTQIRVLRSHAKVLEGLKDIPAAEVVHMRALELDPTNITTLENFAIFLHQKKGELARAEAFFNRGLQICLPGLSLRGSANNTPKSTQKSAKSGLSFGTDASMQGNKVSHIVHFIMSYANFMNKSKGDIEAASILFRKGIDLSPENGFLLATYAHFLSQLGDKESSETAVGYFQRALKASPGNGQFCMWYGKLLKKLGKTSQAELMYKVALERCKGNVTMEPTAICNYATFIFKQRKDPARAHALFKAGLESFPGHKGLRKNHGALLKACPHFSSDAPPQQPNARKEQQGRGAARAEWLARKAQKALREEQGGIEEDNEDDKIGENGECGQEEVAMAGAATGEGVGAHAGGVSPKL